MYPIPTDGTDLRYLATRPGVVPRPRADSRPGRSRDTPAQAEATRFRDWALL